MSGREELTVRVPGGALRAWVIGSGPEVLLLHGGPGMTYSYLDGLAEELEPGFQVAFYQQRGLEPSTVEGPFTIERAIADAVAVLDELGWRRPLIVGHSWGGQLALRLLTAHPDRVLGALAVDPLGIAGDGGAAAFEAEVAARTPIEARERAIELDERAMAGQGTPEEAQESLRMVWPAYFADPDNAPAMPDLRISVGAYSAMIHEVTTDTEAAAAALSSTPVRFGIIAGASSPMPWGQAARATVDLSPTAFLEVVPGAGHFIWIEAPGRVRAALERLSDTVS